MGGELRSYSEKEEEGEERVLLIFLSFRRQGEEGERDMGLVEIMTISPMGMEMWDFPVGLIGGLLGWLLEYIKEHESICGYSTSLIECDRGKYCWIWGIESLGRSYP